MFSEPIYAMIIVSHSSPLELFEMTSSSRDKQLDWGSILAQFPMIAVHVQGSDGQR